jgi:tRNA threonylcarbamoyladenosine biosynthesis protein TsaE
LLSSRKQSFLLSKNKMQINIEHQAALPLVVDALLAFAEGRKKFILQAPMGAGKTTFVKAFCEQLGVVGDTSSPTFSVVNEYEFGEKKEIIRHLDLYRLKNAQEAFDIGVEDFLYDKHYLFVEWPDIILEFLPEDIVEVQITIIDEQQRRFTFL